MEVLHPVCAGLDIHKESVVACVRHMAQGKVTTKTLGSLWAAGTGAFGFLSSGQRGPIGTLARLFFGSFPLMTRTTPNTRADRTMPTHTM